MWSGQAETSAAGLLDMLQTLQPLLRRCLVGSSRGAAAAAAGSSSSAVVPLPQLCIIYNDAAAMQQYLQQEAPEQLRQVFKNVE
jgi:hypothetical protein